MRKKNLSAALLLSSSIILSSCGAGTTQSSVANNNNSAANSTLTTVLSTVAASALSGAVSSASSSAQQNSSSLLSSVNTNSLISGIVGLLTNGQTTAYSIVGNWSYAEPTVQFTSENFLAQAGGTLAASAMVSKISPYYEKVGIKPGVMTASFSQNGTCSFSLNGKTLACQYVYDSASNSVQIISQLGIKLFTANVTLSVNQLAFVVDSSKLLTVISALGSKTNNNTVSSITGIADQYSGMKVGFLFTRQ